jgi:hypothetical protein
MNDPHDSGILLHAGDGSTPAPCRGGLSSSKQTSCLTKFFCPAERSCNAQEQLLVDHKWTAIGRFEVFAVILNPCGIAGQSQDGNTSDGKYADSEARHLLGIWAATK